ncbi:MAG: methyltransferase family protein [Pseudooceanicola sp.]
MKQWLDMPPVWLVLFLALARVQAVYLPMGFDLGTTWARFLGGVLVGGGVLLMALAVYEMRRQRTTVIPHRDADRLVQSGIFSRSRNPIYLGDVLVLTGFIVTWSAVLSLPLIPIFVWILERRFIIPEENRLRRKFRADFARYGQKVRRWV